MSHPAPQQEVPGAHPSAKRRLVSPANNSSPGFHPDYPPENHKLVNVISARRIEIIPISTAELRQQQLRRNREARKRREEEAFYARAASTTPGPKRSKHRGKGRRRHQRL